MKRIGMLTSGGDCQALNAAMRGVVKTLANGKEEVEIYGFLDGYRGLIYGNFRMLTDKDFSGILTKGGTILGTSRTPFKTIQDPDPNGLNKVEAMKQNYYKLQLDCLVILGGNGTHKTANLLRKEGLNIVTLPKTIDNDLWGTDMTFGFQSAVDIATDAIDCIHTTAASHGRVFIVEVMGHKVGWLTLNAGMAGGADIILIPEIPYDIDKVIEKIEDRDKKGCRFTIIAVAEGAISKEDAALTKKDYKKKMEKYPFPSVSYEVAAQIQEKTGTMPLVLHGGTGIGSGIFNIVEETTDKTLTMCLFPITLLPIRRKDGIGKVIIFVNQQVNAWAVRTADVFLKSSQHLSRIGFIRNDNLPNITAQQVLVFQDEILHHHATILAERTLHILQLRTDCREVESHVARYIVLQTVLQIYRHSRCCSTPPTWPETVTYRICGGESKISREVAVPAFR